jgi:quercetin dioxygenase-like cupin family protein
LEKGHVVHKLLPGLVLLAATTLVSPVWGQATTRPCGVEETVGPACLLSRQELSSLLSGPLYWHLDRFASKDAAERAAIPTSTVVKAFGSTWLFTIERQFWRPKRGRHVSDVGPLSVRPAPTYAAEYLRSIFSPGTTAPLHVHSGPEAFYALSGDTCLETPDGMQLARGPGNSLSIKGGPPMLLMAIGKVPRRGFALILHDANQPPTTLIHDWHPQGLCDRQLSSDQAH